jgi:hypothetical protein
MANFTIVKPEPFVVEGTKGTYELPFLTDLTPEQLELLAPVGELHESEDTTPAQLTKAVRDFIVSLCPGIADEPMTAAMWSDLFTAMGENDEVTEGES